jgi:DNA-binding CsgD family transcriptional regulator
MSLDSGAFERVGRFVAEAESVEGDEPFPHELLAALQRLVPCDQVTFSELDRVAELDLGATWFPRDTEDDAPLEIEYWDIREEHPICHHHEVTGDWSARRLTDFLTPKELRRSRIYAEWFRPGGVEHELACGLDSPLEHTKVFIFDRFGGRDFDDADREVLDLLRPYLAHRYQLSQARRSSHVLRSLLERGEYAFVLMDGRLVEYVSPAARLLLARHMAPAHGELDAEVLARLDDARRSGSSDELVLEGGGRSLVVRVLDRALLLEERESAAGLTTREREILDLVGEGKTNAEIAAQLWLSPGTVRRHLENVFAKLGVHTRTAAVARSRHAVMAAGRASRI